MMLALIAGSVFFVLIIVLVGWAFDRGDDEDPPVFI